MVKIAIIGPENSGKSSLSKALAEQLGGCYMRHEYAREYLTLHPPPYRYCDLENIAYQQFLQEKQLEKEMLEDLSSTKSLICDTEFLVLKIWSEYVFGGVSPYILNRLKKQNHDFYLLCKSDLPWVADGLREYPEANERERLFKMYQNELKLRKWPFAIIEGENRLTQALKALKSAQLLSV